MKGDSKESHNKNVPSDCIERELNEQNHTDKTWKEHHPGIKCRIVAYNWERLNIGRDSQGPD